MTVFDKFHGSSFIAIGSLDQESSPFMILMTKPYSEDGRCLFVKMCLTLLQKIIILFIENATEKVGISKKYLASSQVYLIQ